MFSSILRLRVLRPDPAVVSAISAHRQNRNGAVCDDAPIARARIRMRLHGAHDSILVAPRLLRDFSVGLRGAVGVTDPCGAGTLGHGGTGRSRPILFPAHSRVGYSGFALQRSVLVRAGSPSRSLHPEPALPD